MDEVQGRDMEFTSLPTQDLEHAHEHDFDGLEEMLKKSILLGRQMNLLPFFVASRMLIRARDNEEEWREWAKAQGFGGDEIETQIADHLLLGMDAERYYNLSNDALRKNRLNWGRAIGFFSQYQDTQYKDAIDYALQQGGIIAVGKQWAEQKAKEQPQLTRGEKMKQTKAAKQKEKEEAERKAQEERQQRFREEKERRDRQRLADILAKKHRNDPKPEGVAENVRINQPERSEPEQVESEVVGEVEQPDEVEQPEVEDAEHPADQELHEQEPEAEQDQEEEPEPEPEQEETIDLGELTETLKNLPRDSEAEKLRIADMVRHYIEKAGIEPDKRGDKPLTFSLIIQIIPEPDGRPIRYTSTNADMFIDAVLTLIEDELWFKANQKQAA